MSEVKLESLSKSYGHHRVLDGVDITVEDGEFVTLLGPSGCGKTTALRCIAGLADPDGGRVSIGGRVMADPTARISIAPDKRGLGMVFQGYALWPHMTVARNVGYPLKLRRWTRSKIRQRVDELLAMVGLLESRDKYVTQLSGGQQQRVALARALATGTRVVLYDEPLSNLDARLRASVRDEIRSVHDRAGSTSVLVTHDQEEAAVMSDRVILMADGVVVQQGKPEDVFSAPVNEFAARFLGFENVWSLQSTGASQGATVGIDSSGLAVELNSEIAAAAGVAIRSSHLRVGAAVREGDGPIFPAAVKRARYLGDRIALSLEAHSVQLEACVFTHLLSSPQQIPQTDEVVQVQLPLRDLVPLKSITMKGLNQK